MELHCYEVRIASVNPMESARYVQVIAYSKNDAQCEVNKKIGDGEFIQAVTQIN